MKKTLNSLQEYGLTETESLIYINLLQEGESSILKISKKTKLNRSTVHLNVNSLINLGLASQLQKGKKRVIIAEPPEKLQYLIDQEKFKVKKKEEGLKNLVHTIYDEVDNVKENTDSQVKYYEGSRAIANLYKQILKAPEIRAYANTEEIVAQFPGNFDLFVDYARKGGKVWDILVRNKDSERYLELKDTPTYRFKYFPKNSLFEPSDYLIFDDKIAIIYKEKTPRAILISNKVLASNAETIHKLLWDMLEDPY